jgi:hypothetical protein
MNSMGLARRAVLMSLLAASVKLNAQATSQPQSSPPEAVHSDSARQDSAPDSSHAGSSTYTYPTPTPVKPDCNGAPCADQQPHIVVTLPAPAPTPWPVHDRIAWAAYLVLALLGYAGIMLALSTLKKIERHTAAAEEAATAAAETARAALLQAQAIVNAERPWLMIDVEPTPGAENSFNVTATNRGRSPATIAAILDQVVLAVDEAHLQQAPAWRDAESSAPPVPIILLPGEFVTVKTVKREDAKALSGSDEKFRTVEAWEKRLYVCGKVVYNDLTAIAGKETHETNWCCWYIHGRQKSGLTIAGPPAFHVHT